MFVSHAVSPSKYSAPPYPTVGPITAQSTRADTVPVDGARFVTENSTHVFVGDALVKCRLSTAETRLPFW